MTTGDYNRQSSKNNIFLTEPIWKEYLRRKSSSMRGNCCKWDNGMTVIMAIDPTGM